MTDSKTCLAYSAGGHYAELKKALNGIHFSNCYHVTFKSGHFSDTDGVRRYFLTHPRKAIGRTLLNAIQSIRILFKERPEIIISTGADVALATIVFGKLCLRAKVVFIESAGDLTPTMTGRIAYYFSDLFIFQWEEQRKFYPKGIKSKGMLL